MDIKDLKNLTLEQVIEKIHKNELADAVVYTLPLDNARSNFQVSMMGNFIACVNGTNAATSVSIEFNKQLSGAITFTQGLAIARPFDTFFVTHSAQPGESLTFLISSYAPELFGIQDNRSNTLQAQYLAEISEQLVGLTTELTNPDDLTITTSRSVALAAGMPTACILFADLSNTDVIYIGNSNVSATRKIITLQPGDAFSVDDYKGVLYAVAASGSQKLSVGSW